jgi:hypothetical protein
MAKSRALKLLIKRNINASMVASDMGLILVMFK